MAVPIVATAASPIGHKQHHVKRSRAEANEGAPRRSHSRGSPSAAVQCRRIRFLRFGDRVPSASRHRTPNP